MTFTRIALRRLLCSLMFLCAALLAPAQNQEPSQSGRVVAPPRYKGFTGLAFSPDGQILAAGSFDYTIRLWNPKSGALISRLQGHSATAIRIAFSHDGKILASGSGRGDLSIKLWDVSRHELIRTLVGHEHNVNALAFSPDDTVLVSGSEDHTLRFWDVKTGTQLRVLHDQATIWTLSFDPSGKMLAVGNHEGYVEIYDWPSGQQVRTIDALGKILRAINGETKDPVMSLAFRPGQKQFVTASGFGMLMLWDVTSGTRLTFCKERSAGYLSVAISPDGRLVAAGAGNAPGTPTPVYLWEPDGDGSPRKLDAHTGWIWGLAFSPDGTLLASASSDSLRIWDVKTGSLLRTLLPETDR